MSINSKKATAMTKFFVSFLAIITTAAYCLAAWHLSILWSTLVTDTTSISMLSVYTIKPISTDVDYAMAHWQGLAICSLVISLAWGTWKTDDAGQMNRLSLALWCHLSVLLFALFAHIAGGITSLVSVIYIMR